MAVGGIGVNVGSRVGAKVCVAVGIINVEVDSTAVG